MINTKIWSDSWIRQKLNPLDRYLFIYFLTNEHTSICGIYELPIETIAFETGLDERDLNKSLLPRLKPKIMYKNNWVIIPNFLNHQNCKSPTVLKGIETEISRIPKDILDFAIGYRYGIDIISHLNLNLNSNLKQKVKKSEKSTTSYKIINLLLEEIKNILKIERFAEQTQWSRRYASMALRDYGKEKVLAGVDWIVRNWNSKPMMMKTIYYGLAEYTEKSKIVKPYVHIVKMK